jgi:hypothetical protein
MMAKEHWLLCSGGDLPADVVTKLELLTRLAEHFRLATVQCCIEVMELAGQHGVTEVANAAQDSGIEIANAALPIVAWKIAGTA